MKKLTSGLGRFWVDNDGNCHRTNGPAVEDRDGEKQWHFHGKRHREGGPAMEMPDGFCIWFLLGKEHGTSRGSVYEIKEARD